MTPSQSLDPTPNGTKPSAEVQAAVMQLWNAVRESANVLAKLNVDKAALQKKNAKFEEQVQQHATAADKMQAYIEHLQAEALQQRAEIESLTQVLQQAGAAAQTQEQMVQDLRRTLLEHENAITRKDAELERTVVRMQEVDALTTALQQRNEEFAALSLQHNDLQTRLQRGAGQERELEQTKSDIVLLQAELVRRNTEINTRYNEVVEYKSHFAELEDRTLNQQRIVESLRAENARLQEAQQSHLTLQTALQTEQTAHQKALEQVEAERDAIYEQMRTVAAENTTLREALTAYQEQVISLQRVHDELLKMEDEDSEQAMLLQEQIATLQQAHDELLKIEDEDSEQTMLLQEQLTSLQLVHDELLKIEDEDSEQTMLLQENVATLEHEMSVQRTTIADLERELELLKSESVPSGAAIGVLALPDDEKQALAEKISHLLRKVEYALGE